MKPLNRPMFRYGGPIKEGIMDGIKEPQAVNTVGNNANRDASGREKHAFFVPALYGAGMAALRFLPAAYRGFKAARAYTPMSKQLGTFGRIKDIFTPKGGLKITGGKAGEGAGFRTGSFFRQNPIMTASLLPQASVGAYKAGKAGVEAVPGIAKAYIDALVPGESIFREKDGSPKTDASGVSNINKVKAAIGMPENLTYREPKIKETGGGVELSDKEKRQKRIDRYRDIMDIKGMNKAAAYDSLIAASKAIGESGDFKGDLKSGRLINQIIQSTSKAFDKPKQTKDAIDTLILKGEIEKDIKASDPANKVLNELRAGQLQKINKELEGTSFAEAKIAASKTMSGQSGIDAAASVSSDNFRGNLLTKTQLTDVMEKAKGSGDISEQDIIIAATTEVIKGKNLPNGDYTVGDVLVTITKGQVTDIKR